MKRDADFFTSVIKRHITEHMFPATSFEDGLLYSITGMDGDFDIKKTADGELIVRNCIIELNLHCVLYLFVTLMCVNIIVLNFIFYIILYRLTERQ